MRVGDEGEGVFRGCWEEGKKQGIGRKNRQACVIPFPLSSSPTPFKILRVRAVVGLHMLVCLFFILSRFISLHPPPHAYPLDLESEEVVRLHMLVCSFFLFLASSPYTHTLILPHLHTALTPSPPHRHPSRSTPTFT